MKIAIVGGGVAGSYLFKKLKNEFDVDLYECNKKPGCCCAWGIPHKGFEDNKDIFEKYVINKVKKINIIHPIENEIKVKGVYIIDKPKLISDFIKDNDKVFFEKFTTDMITKYDFIIDATGYSRSVISNMCNNGDKYYFVWNSEQHLYDASVDDIYIHFEKIGYGWAFPCGDNLHVGAGGINIHNSIESIKEKLNINDNLKLCSGSGKGITIYNFDEHTIHGEYKGVPIVCVGESAVGTSFCGEGISQAIECAKIFYDVFTKHYYENELKTKNYLFTDYKKILGKHFDTMFKLNRYYFDFIQNNDLKSLIYFVNTIYKYNRAGAKLNILEICKITTQIVKKLFGE